MARLAWICNRRMLLIGGLNVGLLVLLGLATRAWLHAAPGTSAEKALYCIALAIPLAIVAFVAYIADRCRVWVYTLLGFAGAAAWISIGPGSIGVPGMLTFLAVLVMSSLIVALAPAIVQWWVRRRTWMSDPEQIVEASATDHSGYTAVAMLCVPIFVTGLLMLQHWATPLLLAIAALAAFVAKHRRGHGAAADMGFVLLGTAFVGAAVAWLPHSGVNALLGLAAFGVYMLWLARFWHQQLRDGIPWTTAGRMIPVVRRNAIAAAYTAGVLALSYVVMHHSPSAGVSGWPAVFAVLALLLLGSMFVREAQLRRLPVAAWAGCISFVAAAVPAQVAIRLLTGEYLPVISLVLLMGLILALRAAVEPAVEEAEAAYDFHAGLAVPALAFAGWFFHEGYDGSVGVGVVSTALALAAASLRCIARGRTSQPAKKENGVVHV